MTDHAAVAAVANNPDAPAPERHDAGTELAKSFRPLSSSLIPSADLMPVIDFIRDGLVEEQFYKSRGANIIDFPGRMNPIPNKGMRSVYVDDLQLFVAGDWYEKPTPMGFDSLRQMVEATPVLNGVIMTRIRQMSRFCQPSEDGGPGFEIRHIDRQHKLSAEEQKETAMLARFFQNCGWEFNPTKRKRMRRDNFRQMMSKLIRDSLTMDSAPVEREMRKDRRMGVDGLYAVDGSTIRLCTEEGYQGDDEIFALQVVQGRIATAYNYEQLIYEVRNPRADVSLGGYGLGEVELLVRVVTGFLNAMTYNINGFDKNAIPHGMLQLVGDYGTDDLANFKRQWNMMVRGVNNAWSLPVLVNKDPAGKATFEKFGIEFDEMHFAKFMTFLVSIICCLYGMSPEEINFESFAAQKSSLSGGDTSEKLANSKDSGLRPDMSFWEATWTDYVVAEFNPDYCFRWVGLDEEDEKQAWEEKKMVLSVDELRAERGYEKWSTKNPDGPDLGGAPLNPTLIGPWVQAQQQAQQPDFGQPDGAPGGAPGGGDGQPDNGGSGVPGGPDDGQGQPQPGDQGAPAGGDQGGGDFGAKGDEGDFGKAIVLDEIFSIGGGTAG